MAEEYIGEPGQSSIRRDGQSSYTKPATDIYVCGDACALNGQPVTGMNVNIRVGPCAADLRVQGDRVWLRAATLGVAPSDPMPFVTMPLVWERAYGGVATSSTEQRPAFEPRNPIGCGLETNPDDAIGKPVPNIEHPRQPLKRVTDRPQPVGVGPIARHWHPRVSYAGTYDEAWRRMRAPLWPHDFDERFFCSAPTYLQASPHLTGGEVGPAPGTASRRGDRVSSANAAPRVSQPLPRSHGGSKSRSGRCSDRDRRAPADDVLPCGCARAAVADQTSADVAAPATVG